MSETAEREAFDLERATEAGELLHRGYRCDLIGGIGEWLWVWREGAPRPVSVRLNDPDLRNLPSAEPGGGVGRVAVIPREPGEQFSRLAKGHAVDAILYPQGHYLFDAEMNIYERRYVTLSPDGEGSGETRTISQETHDKAVEKIDAYHAMKGRLREILNCSEGEEVEAVERVVGELERWQHKMMVLYATACPGWATDGTPEQMIQAAQRWREICDENERKLREAYLNAQPTTSRPEPLRDENGKPFTVFVCGQECCFIPADAERGEGEPDKRTMPAKPEGLRYGENDRDSATHWEWHFPCGCALHPEDRSGKHGGGPHIHPCPEHRPDAEPAVVGGDRYGEGRDLYERLAEIQHEIWASWNSYVLNECANHNDDGSITITAGQVKGWIRQMNATYHELSEREKASDREQVDRFWPLIINHPGSNHPTPSGCGERERLRAKCRAKNREMARLNQRLSGLEEDCHEMKADRDAARQEAAQWKERAEEAERERDDAYVVLQNAANAWKARHEARQEAEQLREQVKQAADDRKQAADERDTQWRRAERAEQEAELLKNRVECYREKGEHYRQEAERLREQVGTLAERRDDYHRRWIEAEERERKLKDENKRLKGEVKSLREGLLNLSKAVSDFKCYYEKHGHGSAERGAAWNDLHRANDKAGMLLFRLSPPTPPGPGPQEGLKHKYQVLKADGSPTDPDAIYFVLKLNSSDPIHAEASCHAAWTYAVKCKGTHLHRLGEDLIELVKRLRDEQPTPTGPGLSEEERK